MICTDKTRITLTLAEHLESGKPLVENVFRYGSAAWARVIRDARQAYQQGLLDDIDVDDLAVLEGMTGELAVFEGEMVMLEVPETNWDRAGWNYVYVLHDDEVLRIDFETEPVTD